MAGNTSATGGPLTPAGSPAPLEGDALADFIQTWVVGLVGIDGSLVRPRWQPEPPNMPADGVTWMAFGVRSKASDFNAAFVHDPNANGGLGSDEMRRHQTLDCLATFYGPNADTLAGLLNDQMQVGQNREPLLAQSMAVVWCGEATAVPELVKEKWIYRVDLPFTLRRQVRRTYQVQSLGSAQGVLHTEVTTTNINVTQ